MSVSCNKHFPDISSSRAHTENSSTRQAQLRGVQWDAEAKCCRWVRYDMWYFDERFHHSLFSSRNSPNTRYFAVCTTPLVFLSPSINFQFFCLPHLISSYSSPPLTPFTSRSNKSSIMMSSCTSLFASLRCVFSLSLCYTQTAAAAAQHNPSKSHLIVLMEWTTFAKSPHSTRDAFPFTLRSFWTTFSTLFIILERMLGWMERVKVRINVWVSEWTCENVDIFSQASRRTCQVILNFLLLLWDVNCWAVGRCEKSGAHVSALFSLTLNFFISLRTLSCCRCALICLFSFTEPSRVYVVFRVFISESSLASKNCSAHRWWSHTLCT